MARKHFMVVGLGEILWDLLPEGEYLGGAPANFAYEASLLGAKAYVASCIGNDSLGREIIDQLKKLELDHHLALDSEHPTGISEVFLDQDKKAVYNIRENAAWDFIPEDSGLLDLAARTDAVCFGSLCQRSPVSRATIRQFLCKTPPDCIKVFDVNIRQSYYSKEIITTSLELADILKINDEELPVVARLLSLSGSQLEMLEQITNRFQLELIVLTQGASGSLLYSKTGISQHPGFTVKAIDTVGAGDAFAAAVVMGWLQKDDLDRINHAANCLSSYVCTQSGAMPTIPKEILQTLIRPLSS